MADKYDNQIYQQVKEKFSYVEELPMPTAVVDLDENYIVIANELFDEVIGLKEYPAGINLISDFDFSSFKREIEITKANLISTNTEMVKLTNKEGKSVNAEIKIKLSNKVKSNLAVMTLGISVGTSNVIKNITEDKFNNNKNEKKVINLLEKFCDNLMILVYAYDSETEKPVYINKYTRMILPDMSDEEIIKRVKLECDLKNEETVTYDKNISSLCFKMVEVGNIPYKGSTLKMGIGVDITEAKKNEKKTLYKTNTDSLTGLYGKLMGLNELQESIYKVKYQGGAFSLCYLDVDNLELIKERFGEKQSNEYILNVVSTIRKIIRKSDGLYRFNNSEFLVILMDCPMITANKIMKNINIKLEEIDDDEKSDYSSSISYGVIEIDESTEDDVDKVVGAAENKMYRMKLENRN